MGPELIIFSLVCRFAPVLPTPTTDSDVVDFFPQFSHFKFPRSIELTPKLFEGCEAAWRSGFRYQGIFPLLFPAKADSSGSSVWRFVLCNNTQNHASTVILFRKDGGEQFNRSFSEYEDGFGSAKTDYFLGLKHVWNLTRNGFNELKVTLVDSDRNIESIRYPFFRIKPGPSYALGLSPPDEGELPDDLFDHRLLPFSAPDSGRTRADGIDCARLLQSGWWFRRNGNCASALLTGSFSPNRHLCRPRRPFPLCDGVYWSDWRGFRSLATAIVELRKRMV